MRPAGRLFRLWEYEVVARSEKLEFEFYIGIGSSTLEFIASITLLKKLAQSRRIEK